MNAITSAFAKSNPVLVVVLLLVAVLSPLRAHASAPDVIYQIKASYVYNFLQFVNFPAETLVHANQIRFCLLGEDRFGAALDEINDASTPQGRIHVLRLGPYSADMQLEVCNVLYLTASEAHLARQILGQVDPHKVLTIGEFSPFIKQGGLIELYQANDSIRFRINDALVKETLFKVAAQLVQLGVE